jgi:hypothetical protein
VFGALGAIGEVLPSTSRRRDIRPIKAMSEHVNEGGTLLSERVHVREIVVIPMPLGCRIDPAHLV